MPAISPNSKPAQKLFKTVNYQQKNNALQVCDTICTKFVSKPHEGYLKPYNCLLKNTFFFSIKTSNE